MIKRKLGRKIKHRRQMLRNLVSNIIIYEKIKTTTAKAKAVKPIVDKIINIAKNPTLCNKRKLLAYFLHNKNTVKKIIEDIAPRFTKYNGGYIKLYKTSPRLGDCSQMTIIIIAKSKFLGNLENSKITTQSIANKKEKSNEIIKKQNQQ